MSGSKPLVNPYAKGQRPQSHNNKIMGRQSQQRVSNTKRAFQLARCTKKKFKSGDQSTLMGGVAFLPERDCVVCKAQALARFTPNYRVPKRAHHELCVKNKRTKGKGAVSAFMETCYSEEKRLHTLFNTPLEPAEKGSAAHTTKAAVASFFKPKCEKEITRAGAPPSSSISESAATTINFVDAVSTMTADPEFREKCKNKSAPLAMLAFATVVVDEVVRKGMVSTFFEELSMTVPFSAVAGPQYHSIVGQKLYLVDWAKTYALQCPCVDPCCSGMMVNDRTNFSKNKTLFPLFGLDGPPSWCIVMSMICSKCRRRQDANDAEILLRLPD